MNDKLLDPGSLKLLLRYSGAEVAAVCNEAALAALEESVEAQV